MAVFQRIDERAPGQLIEVEPVRQWLKLDDAEPDDIIAMATMAALQKAEHITGRKFGEQVWQITAAQGESISLYGLAPIASIEQDGAALEWVIGNPSTVVAQSASPIEVVCGQPLPEAVQMWVLQRIGFWLENRQMLTSGNNLFEPPRSFIDGLLDPYVLQRM